MDPIKITNVPGGGLIVDPESAVCHVSTDGSVEWTSEHDPSILDWRVVFGSYAPVYKSKVATRQDPALQLKKNRVEDLGHWKYVVVAQTEEGIKHKDPELIVDS